MFSFSWYSTLFLTLAVRYALASNVVLILTDDQDKHLDSLNRKYMPNVNRLIGDLGVRYENHYCTVAWCCPSRVNLLTGKAAHNTNVTALELPYGGWEKFLEQKLHKNWLPTWIHASGKRTYYLGKLMNSYEGDNWDKPYPPGWTNSSFLVDPWTYNYYNSTWTNGHMKGGTTKFTGEHTTDVTQRKALEFIDQAAHSKEQFFMMVAPVAPHAQMINWGDPQDPPPAPHAFKGAFNDSIAPRTPNFNPDEPSGVSWIYNKPKLSDKRVAWNDDFHRHRLRNIAGVDAMVATLIQRLEDRGLLDDTYIIYTTDNGFHIGNHRLDPGKRCSFEEDINIPLLIRGPNMPRNHTTYLTNSHTDIAPTVLSMLGLPMQPDFDGAPIPLTAAALTNTHKSEHVSVEFWDSPGSTPYNPDGDYHGTGSYYNNTYKTLRINIPASSTPASGIQAHAFAYSVWCTGERELYDMVRDPYQLTNLLRSPTHPREDIKYFERPYTELVARLDALLMVLKSCAGDSCRDPYSVLFPKGEVKGLEQAMGERWDGFFGAQEKVRFETCYSGFIWELEGPMKARAFSATGRVGAQVSKAVVGLGIGTWGAVWATGGL